MFSCYLYKTLLSINKLDMCVTLKSSARWNEKNSCDKLISGRMSVVCQSSFHMSSKYHLWTEDRGDNTSREPPPPPPPPPSPPAGIILIINICPEPDRGHYNERSRNSLLDFKIKEILK